MTEPIIRLERVTKRFRAKVAVDDVSFEVARGRCVGWLGPNGSGKTTLIRCMLGLARVSSGSITVRGHPIPSEAGKALERVGGIVEEPRFYPYLTGRGNLEVWAGFLGGEARTRVLPALERVGLAADGNRKVKQYSMGMRQRLGVARSLLSDPELLILDEPSNGLDPSGMAAFREMIRSFVEEGGRTVFVSPTSSTRSRRSPTTSRSSTRGSSCSTAPSPSWSAPAARGSGCASTTPTARSSSSRASAS